MTSIGDGVMGAGRPEFTPFATCFEIRSDNRSEQGFVSKFELIGFDQLQHYLNWSRCVASHIGSDICSSRWTTRKYSSADATRIVILLWKHSG